MPALAGEPWRARAKVDAIEGGTTVFKYAVGTSNNEGNSNGDNATWEGNPGDALTLRFGFIQGVLGPANPFQRARISVVVPGDGIPVGVEWNVNDIPASGNNSSFATRTFHFDSDPLSAALDAALRAGTLELVLTMHREGQAANNYTVNSRGATTGTVPAGTTFDHARGYLRARSKLAASPSVVRATAGEEAPPFAYKDGTRTRFALVEQLYRAEALTVEHLHPSTAAVIRSGAEPAASVGTATRTREFTATSGLTARVNDDYPNGDFGLGIVLPVRDFGGDNETAWAAAGQPAGYSISDSGASGSANRNLRNLAAAVAVDPLLRGTRHLQLNDNVFGLAKNRTSGQRLTADLGFVAARVTNARGEGIDHSVAGQGIAYSLVDAGGLVTPVTLTDQATATRDGEAGWGPLMSWDSQLPGGTWINSLIFEDEAGQQTFVDSTHDFALLASDPRVLVISGGGNNDDTADHFFPGAGYIAATSFARNNGDGTLTVLDPDAGSVRIGLARLNTVTRKAQHWTGSAWTDTGAGPITTFAATRLSDLNPAFDSRVFIISFAASVTAAWEEYDIFPVGVGLIGGTPYGAQGLSAVLGVANQHQAYKFDPIGLFK